MSARGRRHPLHAPTRGVGDPGGPALLLRRLLAVAALTSGCVLAACGGAAAPSWCHHRPALALGCPEGRCVAAVAIDYVRVEPRGFRVFELSDTPALTLAEAEERARGHLVETLGTPPPDSLDCEQDDDFVHCSLVFTASQDRYLVIIFRPTGQVLLAEPEVWADEQRRGFDFPLPTGFAPADTLGCTATATAPERVRVVTTGLPLGSTATSTGADAIAAVRRLNLTSAFVGDRPYRAFAITHAPAIGGFDAEAADWYVWLYRHGDAT
ncbi:MAG: hypothetical protein IPL40_08675 [Proteobacteria bacterium]|nr:hypothetical protein [Pseudomonadota bacterium]